MSDYSKIAAITKDRRQDLSLSQQDLSEMSEVALRTINALETGRAAINLKKLNAIAEVLGLELRLELKKLHAE
jgi:transcriptional regulator with XRE-family HTH domain